jgi:hypothetical protein
MEQPEVHQCSECLAWFEGKGVMAFGERFCSENCYTDYLVENADGPTF